MRLTKYRAVKERMIWLHYSDFKRRVCYYPNHEWSFKPTRSKKI